jgi:lipopolysaccharide/colanic/teichoic acid biosynthesis glycosyltransferase
MARGPYDMQKRVFDVATAFIFYIASLPIQAVVALIIAVRLGRPVLFRQPRPGLNGQIFTLVKFRTMRPAASGEGVSSDAARLTKLGKFLRSTSLDELPSLSNVIKGDMSMVGPRPLLTSYLERYSPEQARRHEVRPGITGLAQINGRNALTWEQKFALDLEYVENRSFRMDVKILGATVSGVLRRTGVAADGHATTTEFCGTPARSDS